MKRIEHNSHLLLEKLHTSSDPIKELGSGISTYHQLLLSLFILFLILSIIHIPVIQSFRSYGFYDQDENSGIYAQWTIGSMGFSKTECHSTALFAGSGRELSCASGQITNLVDWGIVTRFEDHFKCKRNSAAFCNSYLRDNFMLESFSS